MPRSEASSVGSRGAAAVNSLKRAVTRYRIELASEKGRLKTGRFQRTTSSRAKGIVSSRVKMPARTAKRQAKALNSTR